MPETAKIGARPLETNEILRLLLESSERINSTLDLDELMVRIAEVVKRAVDYELFAILLLNEKVGVARWFALIVGFLGVLIVTNPGADTFQVGALFALANAMIYGSVTAAVRGMTATESAETLLMYQLLLITIFFSLMLPFGFTIPTAWDAGWMLFNGLTNAIGQYWWTRALHLAPASAVTPFFYLSLIWAALLGYIVWGDLPTVGLLVGSAGVVGSGLFLLWRESVRV